MPACVIGGTDGSVARRPRDLLFPVEQKCPAVAEDPRLPPQPPGGEGPGQALETHSGAALLGALLEAGRTQ